MKIYKFISIIFFITNIQLPAQDMQEVDCIKSDTIYYSDTILINNDIMIDSNQLLVIEPGCFVEFQGHYEIKINGAIKAIGSVSDSIFFTINDTTLFSDTSTVAGGWKGINLWNRNSNDTSVFKYCSFKYGKSVSKSNANKDSKGGAIYINNYSNILVSNCTFNKNMAKEAGGGLYCCETSIIITDNNFIHNRTFLAGGGIEIIYEDFSDETQTNNDDVIVISDNLFQYNKAYQSNLDFTGGYGAAISVCTSLSLINVKIINNKLFNNYSLSILYESCYYNTIENNIICNNYGIGYYNGHTATYGNFLNNTVCNNYSFFYTGGLTIHSNHCKVKNNIVWNNDGYFYWEDTLQIYYWGHGVGLEVDYNCLNYGYEGEGNIDSLPMFVNPTAGSGLAFNGADADWSLLVESPCINTGTPDTSGLFLPDYDIEGNPRICGFRIDMGAYENQVFALTKPVLQENIFTTVYPNPGQNSLFIKTKLKNSTFELIDFTGKIIFNKSLNSFTKQINTSNIPSGMYFYRIHDNEKIIESGKWVKR